VYATPAYATKTTAVQPAKTIARTIRNQHPDTVVLTFLGPSENGHVELVDELPLNAMGKVLKYELRDRGTKLVTR